MLEINKMTISNERRGTRERTTHLQGILFFCVYREMAVVDVVVLEEVFAMTGSREPKTSVKMGWSTKECKTYFVSFLYYA